VIGLDQVGELVDHERHPAIGAGEPRKDLLPALEALASKQWLVHERAQLPSELAKLLGLRQPGCHVVKGRSVVAEASQQRGLADAAPAIQDDQLCRVLGPAALEEGELGLAVDEGGSHFYTLEYNTLEYHFWFGG